jgi:hypothetical protein
MPITVRRSSKGGMYCYHVADPQGEVDNVLLWRTFTGYFGEITSRQGGPPIRFERIYGLGTTEERYDDLPLRRITLPRIR